MSKISRYVEITKLLEKYNYLKHSTIRDDFVVDFNCPISKYLIQDILCADEPLFKFGKIQGNFFMGSPYVSRKHFPDYFPEFVDWLKLNWIPEFENLKGMKTELVGLEIDYRYLWDKNPYARNNKKILEKLAHHCLEGPLNCFDLASRIIYENNVVQDMTLTNKGELVLYEEPHKAYWDKLPYTPPEVLEVEKILRRID